MAKTNASGHKMYFVETATNKLVAHLNNIKLGGSGNQIDYTTKDNNGFKDFDMGLLSFTLSIDGKTDFQPGTNNRNINDIVTAFRTRATKTVLIKNTLTGDTTYQGSVMILSFEITSGTEEALMFSAELGFVGDLTVGVNA
jgi:predicted secreted protein